MLEPRIYRTGLIAVVLAVIVLAFSLYDEQGPVGSTLAPDAFSGQNAYGTMTHLATAYPKRTPGSAGDRAIAGFVAQQLSKDGFMVSTSSFRAQTANGPRTLTNVTGMRAGQSGGSIVVVAHRDALGSPAKADASGTAVLLELGRVLSGETLNRTILLASTSGSVGAAGAARLARSIGQPVDAVITLGDLAGARVRQPVVVPFSDAQTVAPTMLRTTVAGALAAQAGLPPGADSLASQLAHLAFPISVSEQAPFAAHGLPSVLLSLSGERYPAPAEQTSSAQITGLGRAVLQTVTALDSAPPVPAPSAYILYSGNVIPAWAVRLLVLGLMLPVLGATLDGFARARRRGQPVLDWLMWVLSCGLPFVLAALLVMGARLVGWIGAAPPGPVGAGGVRLHGGEIALLAILGCAILAAFLARVKFLQAITGIERRAVRAAPSSPGAGAAVLMVLCIVALAMWVTNPFAALLLIPALHLWIWVVAPDFRPPALVVVLFTLGGLAAPALVVLYWSLILGLQPLGIVWNGVLMLAGSDLGLLLAIEWSFFLGCALGVLVITLRSLRQPRREKVPVTVRAPVTYAGRGSLSGTGSVVRR